MSYVKIFLSCIFFGLSIVCFSSENKEIKDLKKDVIEYRYKFGYFKNNKHLGSFKDFVEALKPIPEAMKKYQSGYYQQISGAIFLGVSIPSYLSGVVCIGLFMTYGDKKNYPVLSKNPIGHYNTD